VAVWQQVLLAIALPTAALVGRFLYVRFYLRKRLFFEPWANLSRDDQFNTGEALAELLIFELDRVQTLLRRALTSDALWNEKVALPLAERAEDGYTRVVKDVELLGLPGRLTKLIQFVLLAKPQALRGNIQKYGSEVRLQLRLEGMRGGPETLPVRSWAVSFEADHPEAVPVKVADLAHQAFRDLCQIQGFKSPDAFRAFTSALGHHLEYKNVSRSKAYENAVREYRLAIGHDGANALAACNLGDLLYAQYDYDTNELAIEAFKDALNTDNLGLRARAFRGLANAYCQKYQRHKKHERPIVDSAVRAARAAGQICGETTAHITNNEIASIKKAEAYAQQVYAEQRGIQPERRDFALEQAVQLYQQAIRKNDRFSAAFNNLSYLYLEKAKGLCVPLRAGTSPAGSSAEMLKSCLDEAEKNCVNAIQSDRTFYMAYDNRGNIAVVRSQVQRDRAEELLNTAIESYHEALSYRPKYTAACTDLASAHMQLYKMSVNGSHIDDDVHDELAWHYHWESLSCSADEDARTAMCRDFASLLNVPRAPRQPGTADSRAAACSCAKGVQQ
jgi:tetratricopeptide (TPR) repeat protein